MREKSINNWEKMTINVAYNRIQKKPNDLGLKYGNQKHNEKAEWINNITRELEGLEGDPKVKIHTDLLKTTLKIIKLENARP